jgi:hypothetical protein
MNNENDDIQKLILLMSEQFVGRLNNEETRLEMTEFLHNYAKKVYQYQNDYDVLP